MSSPPIEAQFTQPDGKPWKKQYPAGTDPMIIDRDVKMAMTAAWKGRTPPPAQKQGIPTDAQLGSPDRLGAGPSQLVRPVMKGGVEGVASLLADPFVWIANQIPDRFVGGEPPIELPSDYVERLTDKFTTAPTDAKTKTVEFLNSLALGGMIGPKNIQKMGSSLWKLLSPKDRQQIVERLAKEGVTMTPGQRWGGAMNWFEEQLGKFHPSVKAARGKAVEQWNRARLNEVVREAGGGNIPDTIKDIRGAASYAEKTLQGRYDALYKTAKADFTNDSKFKSVILKARQEMRELSKRGDVGKNLAQELKAVLDDNIMAQTAKSGKMIIPSNQIKETEEALRKLAAKYGGDQASPLERHVRDAIAELHDGLQDLVRRQNPQIANELDSLERAYAKFALARETGQRAVAAGGVATPGQRLAAVAKRDKSAGKGATYTGRSPGQKEAEDAKKVLGNVTPDSGTTGGVVTAEALKEVARPVMGAVGAGGAAAGAAGAGDIGTALGILGAYAAPAALYSQPLLRAAQSGALRLTPELMSKLGIVGAAAAPIRRTVTGGPGEGDLGEEMRRLQEAGK